MVVMAEPEAGCDTLGRNRYQQPIVQSPTKQGDSWSRQSSLEDKLLALLVCPKQLHIGSSYARPNAVCGLTTTVLCKTAGQSPSHASHPEYSKKSQLPPKQDMKQ